MFPPPHFFMARMETPVPPLKNQETEKKMAEWGVRGAVRGTALIIRTEWKDWRVRKLRCAEKFSFPLIENTLSHHKQHVMLFQFTRRMTTLHASAHSTGKSQSLNSAESRGACKEPGTVDVSTILLSKQCRIYV